MLVVIITSKPFYCLCASPAHQKNKITGQKLPSDNGLEIPPPPAPFLTSVCSVCYIDSKMALTYYHQYMYLHLRQWPQPSYPALTSVLFMTWGSVLTVKWRCNHSDCYHKMAYKNDDCEMFSQIYIILSCTCT